MSVAKSHLELAREKLSPNNLSAGLPGRETQSKEIYQFLLERLKIRRTAEAQRAKVAAGQVANIDKHTNKTMFACGVPGTGKTSTILSVVHKLKKLLEQKTPIIHPFEHIYVNGQTLSAPAKVYTEILYQLTGEEMNPEKAQDRLEDIFKVSGATSSGSCSGNGAKVRGTQKKRAKKVSDGYKVVILDELDLLYNERRQSIFYSLFDWPTMSESKVILITIANAMDLPERFMRGRISSRIGWEKLVFEPYSSDCLETILKARLGTELMNECFARAAIIVATKRIGRTTGDARRILDTCRLAIDKAIQCKETKVTPEIVDKVGFQNLDLQRRDYIQTCRPLTLLVLKSILLEAERVGEENVDAMGVYRQLRNLQPKHELYKNYWVGPEEYHSVLNSLAAVSMIVLETGKCSIRKRMFLKDSCEAVKDLIKTEPVKV